MLMAMLCRELLRLPSLKNIKVAAGADGLDRIVRWVYAAECFEDNRQIVDWLYGGELVIITGRDIRDNEALLLDLLRKINEKNVSGLLINIGPYISKIPAAAVALADELGLPVLTIPWETKLVEVTREICSAVLTKEMEEKSIDNLLENILSGDVPEDDGMVERAACYGYDLAGSCLMMVIDINHFAEYLKLHEIKDERAILEIKTGFKRIIHDILIRNNRKPLIMMRSDSASILLKSQPNDMTALNEIASQAGEDVAAKLEGMTIAVGVGNAYPKISDLRKSLKEAEQALKIAKLPGSGKNIYFYNELGVYSLLLNSKEQQVLENYYRDVLGKLLEYDRINASELTATLEAFLNENCNITATADRMFVHRNTLKYRMNKIQEIAGYDLRKLKDMVKLEMGFMIGRYLKELP